MFKIALKFLQVKVDNYHILLQKWLSFMSETYPFVSMLIFICVKIGGRVTKLYVFMCIYDVTSYVEMQFLQVFQYKWGLQNSLL